MEKNIQKKPPFYAVDLGGIQLKVFIVGADPRIKKRARTERDPEGMRGVHTHFAYEVFFVTAGTLRLVTEDDTKEYRRAVLVIPPHVNHYSAPDREGSFCLLFAPEEGTNIETVLKKRLEAGVCELPLDEDIAFYIDRLAKRYCEDTPTAQRDVELLISLIFNRMFAVLKPDQPAPKRTGAVSHIGAIDSYINHRLSKRITLTDVAEHVYLSTKQISRIIEKEYGCSFSELVATKRRARAEMLLKNTDMPVSQVASAVFPSSEGYFYVLFKKRFGISPLQYRKESRNFK